MAERKFTRVLSKPGSAAQVRETVSQAVRESAGLVKPQLVEPLDYETFILKNKTILQNDPQREMLLFPLDDVFQITVKKTSRTTVSTIPPGAEKKAQSLFVQECIKSYTADYTVVKYKYSDYSGTYLELPVIPKPTNLQDHVYEVDTEVKDTVSTVNSHSGITKEGYVLKGPESGSDSFISLATKSFKRRYVTLRQQVDGSHILEFHKDERKTESKGTICMEFCNAVIRNSKRGKLSLELRMADGHKSYILATENETELLDWMNVLSTVIASNNSKASEDGRRKSTVSSDSSSESLAVTPPMSPNIYGTLKSLEHSKNPELVKYARETDFTISQARKENRQNLFTIYPDLQRISMSSHLIEYEQDVQPYKEEFGIQIFVKCEEIRFRLLTPLDGERGPLCQVEPYITTLAVYDAKMGRKVSEEFRFDVNHPYIRNMLPKPGKRRNGPSNHSVTTNGEGVGTKMSLPVLADLGEEWLTFPKQAIFTVQKEDPDLYLVVRIEKVLQGGITSASLPYLKQGGGVGDGRLGLKVHRQVRACCQRLGHYRMPFAWAARPLFKPVSLELDTSSIISAVYRQESSKLSNDDLIKLLAEFKKPDKMKHLVNIPGEIKITIKQLKEPIPNTLSSSLIPVHPFPIPPVHNPTIEVDKFPTDVPSDNHPFTIYKNHLYIFPRSLKFDSQKIFTKARNIACVVELRDSDEEGAIPLKCIYGRPGEPVITTQAYTAVIHHNNCPDFYEEVKLVLPSHVHEKHHILFTFYHVSCEPPKNSKRRDSPVENVVGYVWLPLLSKGRLNVDQHNLTVASHLPTGYLSCEPLGLGKGFSGPDIRWLDGGKELFKVELKLVSTVYTKDLHLHNFFLHCQKLQDTKFADSEIKTLLKSWGLSCLDVGTCPSFPSVCSKPRPVSAPVSQDSTPPENARTSVGSELGRELSKFVKVQHGLAKNLKALHAVDISTMINFLPIIFAQLFRLLVATADEEVARNALRVLIHIVSSVHDAGKDDILHSYVQFVFVAENINTSGKSTIHEELTKALTAILRPANTDFLVINKFLKHSWFFFQILTKSMAQHLLSTERIKMHRHERFPSDYQYRIQGLLQVLMPNILQKFKDLPGETRHVNQSLAQFLKKCLNFMDRGFVFKLINFYLDKFNPGDARSLQELKFEFLDIICSHEHFVALNLPVMRGSFTRGHTKNIKDYEQEYRLSEEFCHHHFLVGTLLQEVRAALSEVREIRLIAIRVLHNLFAKHAFDDRYQGKAQQARIVSLYLPFISILLENLNRLNSGGEGFPSPPSARVSRESTGSTSTLVPDIPSANCTPIAMPRHNTLVSEVSHSSSQKSVINGSIKTNSNRDSSYLSMIAGQVPLSHQSVTFVNGSSSSIESSSSSTVSSVFEIKPEDDVSFKEVWTSGQSLSKSHVRSHSMPFASTMGPVRYDKLEPQEVKDLLLCFLYIMKHLNEELLIGWWQHCTQENTLDFFHILELCLHHFKYVGRKSIENRKQISGPPAKAMTLPARTAPPSFSTRCNSSCSETLPMSSSSLEDDSFFRVGLESNMATEVGMITLDVLGLYTLHFKELLIHNEGDNLVMKKVFDIYLSFLQVGQSESLLKHLFAALRAFISKFPVAIFKGNASLCGKLCFELLRCCNSKLSSVRNEACALLYLLMRSNFEFTGRKGLTRVHLQLIVSVSRLLGEAIGLNNAKFQESLSIINNYANSDKAMQKTVFPSEVKDLTKRIRTVLMATVQMREHENDPEMLVDLKHSLANSYAATPALRKTWLESMAQNHKKDGNYSEAAHCSLHIAALEAECLKYKGIFPRGCQAFDRVSPNVVHDESNVKEDVGMHDDAQYTEDSLLERLQECVELLQDAERYELIAEVYRLSIPVYEHRRDYEALASCYKTLQNAYNKIIEVNRTGRRLLGKYYRVAFFGQPYFEEESGKEYIYKEPKVTSLAEISERLHHLFCEKFGKDIVKMIMDSKVVNPEDLDPKYAYIQVTHVTPYFEEVELSQRQTEFERNNDLRRFVFETPFTLSGNKAQGIPEEQCKRRTVLTTINSFAYIKKRIPVFSKSTKVLEPIEVAIDEMQVRVCEIQEVVSLKPTDLKKLQLKLQGSIGVQVNAGPLAYSRAFLSEENYAKYQKEKVAELRSVFRRFLHVCQEALELNSRLVTSDQYEYHENLRKNYQNLMEALSYLLHDRGSGREDRNGERGIMKLRHISTGMFHEISASSETSTV
ncbi:dedicator of cytokinesis protein Ziz isoform X14 [Tachypleus tridentatus]|uniref:dedicator of cytokinesis protein Ziz isoform X14 n=1 Tax=Tachypleus tridentatus TaxID=6853 RepID=UPI003FD63258